MSTQPDFTPTEKTTETLGLPLFGDHDKPTWRGHVNYTNISIDNEVTRSRASVNDVSIKVDNVKETLMTQINANMNDANTRFNAMANSINILKNEFVSITNEKYGAIGDGVTDCYDAIVKALADTSTIFIPAGNYRISKTITLPDGDVNVVGNNAVLTGTGDSPVFRKTGHDKLEMSGIKFTDCSGFFYDSEANTHASYDFNIQNCNFENIPENGYGLNFYGAREGNVKSCSFIPKTPYKGIGIKRSLTVNTGIDSCYFTNLKYGVMEDGKGHGNSCGLRFSNSIMIGCVWGLWISQTYDFRISSSMIDYCDNPVYIDSQVYGGMSNVYLGARTNAPCVMMVKTASTPNQNMTFTDIMAVCYVQDGTSDAFNLNGGFNIVFNNVSMSLYGRYGILYSNLTRSRFTSCTFAPNHNTTTSTCLANIDSTSSASNRVTNCHVAGTMYTPGTYLAMSKNTGYVNEAAGVAVIPANSNTVTIKHGMNETPNVVTLSNASRNIGSLWYSGVNATDITIYCATAPTVDTVVSWRAAHTFALL